MNANMEEHASARYSARRSTSASTRTSPTVLRRSSSAARVSASKSARSDKDVKQIFASIPFA
jgi:hypothetical protein